MKYDDFIDDLKAHGVRVKNGANHLKLYYKDKQTTCPRHPSREISDLFAKKVKKQLGI